MLTHLGGVDHVVVLVRELDAAAATYRRLGFTVAPRGTHSAHMGTGNHCVMLQHDYFELLGVVAPAEANASWRALLETREGMTAVALRAHDAEKGAAEIAARGAATAPVQRFGRPVDLPDGTRTETRFQTFHIAEPPAPGLRLFACQHLTPEATWVPGLTEHANTATALAAVEVLATDPAESASGLARLLDRPVSPEVAGAVAVETGAAPIVFLTRDALAARYPGLPLGTLPEAGPVALAVRMEDRAAASRCLDAAGIVALDGPGGLATPPAAAHGVVLAFRG
jgi:catechol 2,3-dioxygenase-like lactoylglutathione lyase family enzyme